MTAGLVVLTAGVAWAGPHGGVAATIAHGRHLRVHDHERAGRDRHRRLRGVVHRSVEEPDRAGAALPGRARDDPGRDQSAGAPRRGALVRAVPARRVPRHAGPRDDLVPAGQWSQRAEGPGVPERGAVRHVDPDPTPTPTPTPSPSTLPTTTATTTAHPSTSVLGEKLAADKVCGHGVRRCPARDDAGHRAAGRRSRRGGGCTAAPSALIGTRQGSVRHGATAYFPRLSTH